MNIEKLLAGFFSVFLCATCAFGEESDEITKIDKRLEELKLIWNQEQAIINGYTKNRTVPVQKGTRAHQAVLVSLQRIQMAEAEAAKLKENRKNFETGEAAEKIGTADVKEPSDENNKAGEAAEKIGTADVKEPSDENIITVQYEKSEDNPIGEFTIINNHTLDSNKNEPTVYSKNKYGAKVKDLYVGMDIRQAMKVAGDRLSEFRNANKKYENLIICREISEINNNNYRIAYSLTDRAGLLNLFNLENETFFIEMIVDSKGSVTEIMFTSAAFNIGENLQDFISACEKALEIDFKPSLGLKTEGIGGGHASVLYEYKFTTGQIISISQFLNAGNGNDGSSIEFGKISANDTLVMRLSKGVSTKELENQFD